MVENALFHNVEESFEKICASRSLRRWLTKFHQLCLVCYISGKMFM